MSGWSPAIFPAWRRPSTSRPARSWPRSWIGRRRALDEWGVFHGPPCPLLRGNLCAIYAARPDACRAYPAFTPDFRWSMPTILEGAGQCPIIFNVIERLKTELGW